MPWRRLAWLRCAAAQVGFVALASLWRRFRRGVAATSAMVQPYGVSWDEANRLVANDRAPLWVVLGDSAAQGIGATAYDRGYVGQLRARLEARDGRDWRVLNLSRSGARTADVLADQLPALRALAAVPDLVTCLVGGNDLLRTPTARLVEQVRRLLGSLPAGAVVATFPQGLAQRKAAAINAIIRAEAPAAGLRVADLWAHTGPPWKGKYADDLFHPNDVGYRDWAAALAEAVGAT